ncbi:MAG: Gfo/Idh/MocA family oxidoreductase, partial [Vicinamibacteria bacterium]
MRRRDFIRATSAAGAGIGLLGLPSRAAARVLGANDRIRIALVGFSDRARQALIPAFRQHAKDLNAEIFAVSDLWTRRRDEAQAFFAADAGAPITTYRNNEELYEKGRPDAVFISTADFQHATHTIEAVAAGADAYVEKPFAETMADARAALSAVRKSDRIVQIGSQRRSGTVYQAAKRYLDSGAFGPIVACEMTWNVNQPGRWRRPELVA